MAEGEDQAVARLEVVKGSVKLTNGDGSIELVVGRHPTKIELDNSLAALRDTERGANDVLSKPGREGLRIS